MSDELSIRVPLTAGALREIRKPHRGRGGFQSLLRKLAKQVVEDGAAVMMSAKDFERWIRYSTKYGEGGFEERLRSVKD